MLALQNKLWFSVQNKSYDPCKRITITRSDNSENMKTKILLSFAIFTQDERTLGPGHFAMSSGGGFVQ